MTLQRGCTKKRKCQNETNENTRGIKMVRITKQGKAIIEDYDLQEFFKKIEKRRSKNG
jgi:hypothetical protein